MSAVEFGARVRFEHILRRRTLHTRQPNRYEPKILDSVTLKRWENPQYAVEDLSGEGILIGKRTLWNGTRDWGEDYIQFNPVEKVTAFVVAYAMHRNPVYVAPEHLTVLAPPDAPDVPQIPDELPLSDNRKETP